MATNISDKRLTRCEQRAIEIANHMIETGESVRKTAKSFGVSKSTIHKDVTERLNKINPKLAAEVQKVLKYNQSERHIRGGQATKNKYLLLGLKK